MAGLELKGQSVCCKNPDHPGLVNVLQLIWVISTLIKYTNQGSVSSLTKRKTQSERQISQNDRDEEMKQKALGYVMNHVDMSPCASVDLDKRKCTRSKRHCESKPAGC